MQNRKVCFFNISSIPLEVERAKDSSLKGRPCIITTPEIKSPKVDFLSEEAANMGIVKGDSVARLRSLFSDVSILSPKLDEYQAVSKKLESYICRLFPVYEPEEMGKIYIDYTGMQKIYGTPKELGLKLHQEVKQKFSLHSMIGVAENKFVSKLVAGSLLDNQQGPVSEISREQVRRFLAPLDVNVIPPIKKIERKRNKRLEVLDDLDLTTVGAIQQLDKHFLEVAFGHRLGGDIYQFARGVDFSPVCLPRQEAVLEESKVFAPHSNDLLLIYQSLKLILLDLTSQLRATRRFTCSCSVLIRYTDFSTRRLKVSFKTPLHYAEDILNEINASWKKVSERRLAIQLIQVELAGIGSFPEQLCLFGPSVARRKEKIQALLKKSS